MSVRTYCVIPHTARGDTDFFQGVFEDGIRVRYQGRLHSLLFSHVLSPAHDYVKHVNGPLLAMLRDGGNATLLIATPYAENTPGDTTAGSASSSAAPSPSHSLNVSEATAVAMELYSQLFPLLFRAVETCAVAHVSAVTVSAEERVLLDCLRGDARLRSLAEASRVTVRRQHSATEWGTVLHVLERRHAALEQADAAASSSLASQTACVVVVEMEGHGRLAVVDVASSQALLQQLTLILGMEREGEERTFPSHTPLREVLRRNVPPLAAVQVVCLPAPQDAVRQTMRVLHFGSTIEAMRSELPLLGGTSDSEERERGGGGAGPSRAHRDTAAAAARAKVFTRPSAPTASRPLASASSSPSFVAAAPQPSAGPHVRSTSSSRRSSPARSSAQEKSRGEEQEEEEGDDGATRVMPQSSERAPALRRSSSYDTRNTAREPSGAVRATERRSSGSSRNESTPARLPLPKSRTGAEAARQQAREDQLRHRVAALEATVAAMDAEVQQAQAARDEAVRGRARAELELRSKANALADLQRAHSKAAQEKADYTQLVEKLMRQVRLLEKDTSRQKRQDMTVVKELRQVKAERAALEQQLSSLRKEVMLFRRDATYRAREGTLSRIVRSDVSIPATSSAPAGAAAAQRGSGLSSSLVHSQRLAPRARRLYDNSLEEEERTAKGNADNKGGAATDTDAVSPATAASPLASSGRVRDITVEELRWRNRHLEEEVNRLQERLLGLLTQPNRSAKLRPPPGDNSNENGEVAVEPQEACKACDATMERLERVSHKLERTQHERDRLRSLLRSSAVLRSRREDSGEESDSEASTVAAPGDGGASGKRSRSAQERGALRVLSDVDAVQGVAASLLAGCASLHAQLECAQALLDRRLRQHRSSDGATAAAAPTATDPLSHLSARVIAEHHEAVAALAESLRHIASKPAVSPPLPAPSHSGASALNASLASQALPPVPRTATAANVETLTHYLSFEAERCRHLRAFVPTFAQLAVATEHLLMRLEATEPER